MQKQEVRKQTGAHALPERVLPALLSEINRRKAHQAQCKPKETQGDSIMKTNEFPSYEEIEKTDGFDRIEVTKNEAGRCLHICPHDRCAKVESGPVTVARVPIKVGSQRCSGLNECPHFVRKEERDGKEYVVCSFTADMLDLERKASSDGPAV